MNQSNQCLFAILKLISLLSCVLLTACVATTVQQIRQAETGLKAHQTIAILGSLSAKTETEADFLQCVSDKASTGDNALDVINEQEFIDALFPWFEPRIAPTNMGELGRLVDDQLVKDKVKEVGVKYIVWIGGNTQRIDQSGTLQCAFAIGGVPACFGFLSWEGKSDYEATVWDLDKGVSVGKLSSEASGTSFIPAIVVPLPFIARVQATACTSLADQLKQFIDGGQQSTIGPTPLALVGSDL